MYKEEEFLLAFFHINKIFFFSVNKFSVVFSHFPACSWPIYEINPDGKEMIMHMCVHII